MQQSRNAPVRRVGMADFPPQIVIQKIGQPPDSTNLFEDRRVAVDVCGASRFYQRIDQFRERAVTPAVRPDKSNEHEIERTTDEPLGIFKIAEREIKIHPSFRCAFRGDRLIGPADIVPCHSSAALRKCHTVLARPTTQVENAFVFESADPLFQLTEQCHVYIAPLIFRVTASVVCGKRIPAFLRPVK